MLDQSFLQTDADDPTAPSATSSATCSTWCLRGPGSVVFVDFASAVFHTARHYSEDERVILLDATADPQLIGPLFEPRLIEALGNDRVRPAGRIIQLMDFNGPRSYLNQDSQEIGSHHQRHRRHPHAGDPGADLAQELRCRPGESVPAFWPDQDGLLRGAPGPQRPGSRPIQPRGGLHRGRFAENHRGRPPATGLGRLWESDPSVPGYSHGAAAYRRPAPAELCGEDRNGSGWCG